MLKDKTGIWGGGGCGFHCDSALKICNFIGSIYFMMMVNTTFVGISVFWSVESLYLDVR